VDPAAAIVLRDDAEAGEIVDAVRDRIDDWMSAAA